MKQPNLLSFEEAELAGEAMFDRWTASTLRRPPFSSNDGAWSDLARAAWEAVQTHRAQVDRSPQGQDRADGLDRNDESAVAESDAPKGDA